MITTRIAAAFAVGTLAVGTLAGSAGTIVLREATTPNAVDWTAQMSQVDSMMGGSGGMMGGSGGMMSDENGTGPETSAMPDWMQQHHQAATPVPAQ